MSHGRDDRWQHLVSGAFLLDEAEPQAALHELRAYLHSVLEVFPRGLEPPEDFEAYAVRRMAGAILRALESASRRGGG
ncbi:MAG TPA: hypothetical protein PK668_05270 [Myxococcota bacterium]|nr:hypothetical protein [Myxococcota bacterium]HRY92269.1 hypothetical protein [Myxococcota bacterium]HSA24306.1 hypothetical protein [Myxococcota bacterium]